MIEKQPYHLTQQHLLKNKDKLSRFTQVHIRSGQWGSWWRANGSGYTTDINQAGIYTPEDAWSYVSHCGPEKRIVLFEATIPVPETSITDQADRITSLESHNRELLAVIAAKDAAIHQMLNVAFKLPPTTQQEHDVRSREVNDATQELKRAFSINQGDIALIEVGIVVENNLTHWQTMPVSAEFNSNELKINDKLYIIQTKSNTE